MRWKFPRLLTVEEYLQGQLRGEVRHEYIGGVVYAMAGSSEDQNTICLNFASALHPHLRGKTCRLFMNDLKVRLCLSGDDVFYYPDLMVVCDPRDTDRYFKRYPRVLIEVLSEATERTDRREKFLGYIQIDTLEQYVLVAQDRMELTVFRRASQWRPEVLTKPEASLKLASLDFSLPLSAIYEGVNLQRRG
jgi:Uma2 family endonuclease